ncbi:MAG TPA: methylated-DNA--[protein]-cysteine S-methyltransferase [Casimicrobiaceae bacterium]
MKTISYATWTSPLGSMLFAASEDGLIGAWFEGQRHFGGRDAAWQIDAAHPVLRDARRQLEAYFDRSLRRFELALDPAGTAFQRTVWRAIAAVPYGEVLTYGELARAAGAAGSARAAGAATGRNPLSIIVPCHRIVGAGGALTGYAGGLERKRALLDLENTLQARIAA